MNKMLKSIFSFAALISLMLMGNLRATTYYVDNNTGNDGNSGKSTTLAWKTLNKVNGFSFASGDTISLKCGSRFYTTLSPQRNNLLFNSYGTGSKPVIDGQGMQYCVDLITHSRDYITFNSLRFVNGATCINMYNCNHITFESCNIDSASGTLQNNIYSGMGTYLTIRNSTLSYSAGANGIYIDGTDNAIMEYDTLFNNAHDGFRIAGGDDKLSTNNLTVRYCIIRYNHYAQIENSGAINSNFYYNVIETDPQNTTDHAGTAGIYMHDQNVGFYPMNCNYYNNTIINHKVYSWDIFALYIQPTSNMTGMSFKNNIFYCPEGGQFIQYWEHLLGDGIITNSWAFTNNLYYIEGSTAHLFNMFGTNYSTLSAWQSATGFEVNSLYANPLLTNYAAGNYSLQSGSPAINSGTYLGLTTDLMGTLVPNASPDLGALQHYLHQ
jgi:hypothetical protein